MQLLLPVTGHRSKLLNRIKSVYNRDFQPLVNENDQCSLGLIGSLGMLLLLGRFFCRRDSLVPNSHEFGYYGLRDYGLRDYGLRDAPALLCSACIILGTSGGLSSLVALLISAKIRSYNRICVYIAFLAFFSIVLAVERLGVRLLKVRSGRPLYVLVILALLTAGIWDQTNNRFIPPYAEIKQEFRHDEGFIRTIEAHLPEGAWVFQLPYACFPEQGPIQQMIDYDHLRGYLHSQKLCWSYGCMKGRAGDTWSKEVSMKPAEELVPILARAGFRGIYINRAGFADGAFELEKRLAAILKVNPLVSCDKTLAFFAIAGE